MENPTLGERINFIDAFRGLAVLLMIEQHLGIWLWNGDSTNMNHLAYNLLFIFNALGGYASPVFITVAGIGSSLFFLRHSNIKADRILALRGIIILFYGYLLNILTPSWFSAGSWYVLHMIGFAILMSPLLRRVSSRNIFIIFVIIIIVTIIVQNLLDTPLFLTNERMRNFRLKGGVFRLAFAEGQFPIFPWLCFYLTGIITGRWIIEKKTSLILYTGMFFHAAGLISLFIYLSGCSYATRPSLIRVFRFFPGLYPISSGFVLMLLSIVLFGILIFRSIGIHRSIKNTNPLVCLGRTSLTLLIVHVVIFREVFNQLNLKQAFPPGIALIILFGALLTFTVISVFWQKIEYRFGAEWLLRKIAG